MPRNYQKKGVLNLDRADLEKAFNHRVETGCSIRAAAIQFGVKTTTLMVGYAT